MISSSLEAEGHLTLRINDGPSRFLEKAVHFVLADTVWMTWLLVLFQPVSDDPVDKLLEHLVWLLPGM